MELKFTECRFQQLHRAMFPIHERVTLAHCHCSPPPAVIYWSQNAGQPDDVVHGATRDSPPPSAFVLSFQLGQPHKEQTHTNVLPKKPIQKAIIGQS